MKSFRTLWSSRRRPMSLAAAMLASVACASGELQEGLGPQTEARDTAVAAGTGSVASVQIQGLTLSPTSASLTPGATRQFAAIGWIDGNGTPAPGTTWTATGGTVSSTGLYTAGSVAGTYEVKVVSAPTYHSETATITISGSASQPTVTVSAIVLTPGSRTTVYKGATQQYSAAATMSNGTTQDNASVTWSATGGTISSSGLYRAGTTSGYYSVIARSSNGRADTSQVTIPTTASTINTITVTPATASLAAAASQQFTASAKLMDGSTLSNPTVTWSATGGSVSSSGRFTAGSSAGSYRVIARSSNGKADTSAVTVTASQTASVTAVSLTPATVTLNAGGSQAYNTQVTYSNGLVQTNPSLTWSATGGSMSGQTYVAGSTAGTYRVIATAANGKADTSVVTVVASAPPPPTGSGAYTNKPSNYTRVISELDMSQPVPSGSGERYLAGLSNTWSVIYDANGSGSNFTRIDDPTAPKSASSVWQLRFPAGTWTDGHGSGNIGRPLPSVNEIYVSYWVKWDAQFEFHPISSKHLRFEKDNGNFLVQASHNNDYLRASDEGIGQAYEPQNGSKPALGVWHQVEVLVKTGSPGTVKVWLDGQLRTNYSNLPVTGPFRSFSIDGHLGGGGMTKVRDSFMWIDHLYIATP